MDKIDVKYDITLDIQKDYNTIQDFFNENKNEIFKSFLTLFHKMNMDKEKNDFSLCIKWKINDSTLSTEYQYNRDSIDMLNNILLPHFEEIEEYEICSEILKLYTSLKNN